MKGIDPEFEQDLLSGDFDYKRFDGLEGDEEERAIELINRGIEERRQQEEREYEEWWNQLTPEEQKREQGLSELRTTLGIARASRRLGAGASVENLLARDLEADHGGIELAEDFLQTLFSLDADGRLDKDQLVRAAEEILALFDSERSGGPGAQTFDEFERRMWLDLWSAPWPEVLDEGGYEARRYGPVLATIVREEPREPFLNNIFGASSYGAVRGGHLREAITWVESLGIDCRLPILPNFIEGAAAEKLLRQHGWEHAENWVRYMHCTPLDIPKANAIDIRPVNASELAHETDENEGADRFDALLATAYLSSQPDSDPMGIADIALADLGDPVLFGALPERESIGLESWHCYVAVDSAGNNVGAAAMLIQGEIAKLAFSTVKDRARSQGCDLALIHRQLTDARAADCTIVFAESKEPPLDLADASTDRQSLLKAGFQQIQVRTVWRPSRR